MKYVYVHTKSVVWNSEGEMDYLLNTVQKVMRSDSGLIRIIDKKRVDPLFNYRTITKKDCTEAIPNNPLSRALYPNYKITECGEFLYGI